LDYAVRTKRVTPADRNLIDLVRQKLAIPGNEPIDLSEHKLENLRKQINIELKLVLRNSDFAGFDLDRAFETVTQLAEPLLSDGHGPP
jgi:hypothetical protein